MGPLIRDNPERRERETEVMLRLLVISALVAAVSSEADPQYFINPYYTPYQPVVSYYPQPASYPQYQQVVPSSYAEPKEDKTSELKPTLYTADPGVRWRTDGQRMANGFNSASGADPNKYTDKYSYPGSYQGRKKREAEPQQYIVNPYTYSFPQYQTVAAPVQAVSSCTPTMYSADPGFLTQIQPGSGKYLPDLFGWDRGTEHFKKWLNVPTQLRGNKVRWRTDGQRMSNGFNSASGADPNKYTDKYSYPGSYQG